MSSYDPRDHPLRSTDGPGAFLAERIRRGERTAEDELVEHFHPRVQLMLEVQLGDREAAEDLAQEVILAVLQALRNDKLEDDERLPSYVWSTARNMARGHFQKQRKRGLEVDFQRLTSGDDPERNSETSELLTLVSRALRQLKPSDQRILLLMLVDGLKPREVAERLGMRPDLVRQRKSRGLRAIRQTVAVMSRNGCHND